MEFHWLVVGSSLLLVKQLQNLQQQQISWQLQHFYVINGVCTLHHVMLFFSLTGLLTAQQNFIPLGLSDQGSLFLIIKWLCIAV
jgi:hypothetical protein